MRKGDLVLMWEQFKHNRPMAVVDNWGTRRYIYNMDATHVEYTTSMYKDDRRRIKIKNFIRWVNKPVVYQAIAYQPADRTDMIAEEMYNE